MQLPTIPEKLEEFDIPLLNKLIKITSIESDNFDFKLEPNNIHEDICAMANNKGGILVLGIDQINGKDDKTIIEFKKVGFHKGEEDIIGNKINNYRFIVEPIPTISINHIYEDSGVFYTVIKIESKISEKPYFVKNTDQCYVRLHSSSQRVGRTAILNLFGSSIELRKNIEKLRVASSIAKGSIMSTSNNISSIHPATSLKLATVDLTFLRDAILSAEWFLREMSLFGEHTSPTSQTIGVNSILYDIASMNSYIDAYNREPDVEKKRDLSHHLNSWSGGSNKMQEMFKLLDNVIISADKFLAKYK